MLLRNILLVGTLLASALSTGAVESRLVHITDSAYGKTSVNTAIFRASPLATHGDTQFVSYYDHDGRLVLGKRNLGSDRWELRPTQYTGHVADAHNVISIGIDGDGYLHVAFDHHGNRLKYARSLTPFSLELG